MFKSFAKDRRGNVAMMFAIAVVPLIAATGAAIDFSRAYEQRVMIQDALDSAALAANKLVGLKRDAEIRAEADRFYRTNLEGRVSPIPDFTMTIDGGSVLLTTSMAVPTTFLGIIGIDDINFDLLAETISGGVNLEVALVLDITGSMGGQKIVDLKAAATDLVNVVVRPEQTPYYTKVALVPYSMGVNVGSYAASVRGTIPASVNVTGASWAAASAVSISSVSNASQARVTTTTSHNLQTGDTVYIDNIYDNGYNSIADHLNGNYYTITRDTSTRFYLNNINSSGWRSWSSGSGGTVRECTASTCELVLTESASGTPFSTNGYVYLTSFNGSLGNYLNNTAFVVGATTSTSFNLAGTTGTDYPSYTSGGTAYCADYGCQYFRFMNASSYGGSERIFQNSTCVSERTGTDAYTDVAPSVALVGHNYPASNNPCPSATIVPLTSDKTLLAGRISNFAAAGSTAGHIGIAWGWYLLSPNWGYLWPTASQPAAYSAPETRKVAVLMTDGAFNTTYCNGVISRDADSGSGNTSDHINCNAPNGDSFDQALALCAAMKQAGIIIYTIGFEIADEPEAIQVMHDCASSANQAYVAQDGAQLRQIFASIGTEISQLRLAR